MQMKPMARTVEVLDLGAKPPGRPGLVRRPNVAKLYFVPKRPRSHAPGREEVL
jgi:hypothetical protein